MTDEAPQDRTAPPRVWLWALAAGLVATAFLYDARIGINVPLCTAVAAAGLFLMRPAGDAARRLQRLPLAFALLLAGGAAMTADARVQAAIVLVVLMLLALATRLAALAPSAARYDALFIALSPPLALIETLGNGIRTTIDGIGSIGGLRRRPVLRGALLGAAVIIVFAALFADADPLFARGRDAVTSMLDSLEFVPRLAFLVATTFGVLGAYAYASRTDERAALGGVPRTSGVPRGDRADRAIVLGAAAIVCWIFVVLQLVYLAIDIPARVGSGVTYAQYAHRGFGQLSIVATLALLLVVEAFRGSFDADTPPRVRGAGLALLTAVAGVLVSGFHRVTLYEDVYGYTTMRIEAQAYMLCVLALLALSAWEVTHRFDAARLARGAMTVALTALLVLAVWNDQAWVVRKDVERFTGTARLDVRYLSRLSPDAYPALLDALPRLPEPQREALASRLWPRATCAMRGDERWFKWNASRARARTAFRAHGFSIAPYPGVPCSTD